jgi:glycosyltransferase involved in cell wall biosynthesis
MQLSVIVPCLDEAEFIGAQLEALAAQRWAQPWEVIVADNGSTDGTLAVVERYKDRLPRLRILDASARRGQAHAKNVGARHASGAALAFCDADDEVAPGWVAAIGEALGRYDFVASRFDVEKLNPPQWRAGRGTPQRDGLQRYWYPPFLPHAGGCGLGIKRALHEAIGGYDESWPVLEDTDYCFRVQLSGTPLHFVPEAVVHIRFPQTRRGVYRQAYTWGQHNVRLYKRYRPFGMPALSWQDGAVAWLYLLRGLPQLRSKPGLHAWLWQFAWRLGRLHGSLRHGVLAL